MRAIGMGAIVNRVRRQENRWLTLLFLVVLCVVTALRYDFYYDLNDDVLMKDILAGVYTGVPESRNIQMLYLISALISFFYRLLPDIPWYGLFLCICQFGSIGLILNRSLRFCRKRGSKLILLLMTGVVLMGTMLEHLVFVQYTVTGTMLAAAAVFLMFTSDVCEEERTVHRSFFRKNLLPLALMFLAFLVRSEMFLLILPLICGAGVCKWGEEQPVFTGRNAVKYCTVFAAILGGLGVGLISHTIAYGREDWVTFTAFFDYRTSLYDYEDIPVYEEHAAFYESIGLSESEVALLHNYNFGLDEEINDKTMGEIAAYAAAVRRQQQPFSERFAEKIKLYYYRMTHTGAGGDFPWNFLILSGYAGLAVLGICRRRLPGTVWKLVLLAGIRSALWMYILMADRYPSRISHSLSYMEFCVLWGMLLVSWSALIQEDGPTHGETRRLRTVSRWVYGRTSYFPLVYGAVVLMLTCIILPGMISEVGRRSAEREQANQIWQAVQAYCRSREDHFYFIDVYSTVDYSEKMFVQVDNSFANYDLMGGWACKSPLYVKKLEMSIEGSMEDALVGSGQVYMIMDAVYDTDWLEAYYSDRGRPVSIVRTDGIADRMWVYKVSER